MALPFSTRRLLLIVLLLNLFVIVLAALAIKHGHRQATERARVVAENLAYALESDLNNSLKRIDIALMALLDIHEIHYADHWREPKLMAEHIETMRVRLPEVDAIRLTDAEGILVFGSDVDPAARVSLADRPHFTRLRDNPELAVTLSKPQISRVNDKWVIVLARRIPGPEGRFDGMIFAAIALDDLTQQFARIDLGPRGTVELLDAKQEIIARHPPAPGGLPDPAVRTTSLRPLQDFPLHIGVGLAAEDYLEDWRTDASLLGSLALLFLLASLYAAHIQHRGWRRHQRDHLALERQEALYHELVEDSPTMVVRYHPDTTILFANRAYAEFFGMPAGELVGRRWLEFIAEDEDRTNAALRLANLSLDQPVSGALQYRMLGRDGQTHWTQWTDRAFFDEKGELAYLQSVGEDITERKRSRDVQAARLRLMEYAVDHNMHDLLVATLDEACALTESPIGFYHFLAADQKTLSLQAWSTRTLAEYCHAEGEGRHYNIDEAGVWVEAIRERRAIIHNDYAALPNKRGLPPGHAEVLREMVVPVFRKGLIVAILGVGNKPRPYTNYDMETVTLLADLAWDFAESKRLEAELVEMATTDALTGLANRRSFLLCMERELARLKRFDIPRAAVLMLDLDHFKHINDTHGHAVGDDMLRHFSRLVQEELRKIDTGGRLGGEEFAILLVGADREAAEQFAERIRRKVADTPLDSSGTPIPVTVSIGIAAVLTDDDGPDASLMRADAALYEAKHSGRNRVCMHLADTGTPT